jgi:hypothetical protein
MKVTAEALQAFHQRNTQITISKRKGLRYPMGALDVPTLPWRRRKTSTERATKVGVTRPIALFDEDFSKLKCRTLDKTV